jgi:prolyl-tRNA synthetase
LENNQAIVVRRDTSEKETVELSKLAVHAEKLLETIQNDLFARSKQRRVDNTYEVNSWEEFVDVIENKKGFALAHWDGTTKTEEEIQQKTKATIRCIPFDQPQEDGKCVLTGKPSKQRVLFAKAY